MDVPSYLLGKKAGGGGSYTETDPIFSASPASGITSEDIEKWNSGGGSSDGDFAFYNFNIYNLVNTTEVLRDSDNGFASTIPSMINAINECYIKDKIPVFIINGGNGQPIMFVGQSLKNKPTYYEFKGIFAYGDHTGRTTASNKNVFGLSQLVARLIWNGDVAQKTGQWNIYKVEERYLPTDNTLAYTPTAQYHPATKGYVDSAISTAITSALGGSY